MKTLMVLLAICLAFFATSFQNSYAVNDGPLGDRNGNLDRMGKQVEKQTEGRDSNKADKADRQAWERQAVNENFDAAMDMRNYKPLQNPSVTGTSIGPRDPVLRMLPESEKKPPHSFDPGEGLEYENDVIREVNENFSGLKPAPRNRDIKPWETPRGIRPGGSGVRIPVRAMQSSISNFEIPKGTQTGWRSSRHRSQ